LPVNRWLIARGKGHAVVHAHHAHWRPGRFRPTHARRRRGRPDRWTD